MPESYTGTEGTAAAAAGLPVLDGTEKVNQGHLAVNKTRDMVATRVFGTAQIANGAVTVAKADTYTDPSDGANKIPRYNSTGKLATNDPTAPLHAANKQYVDAKVAAIPTPDLSSRVAKTGDTMTGNLGIDGAHLIVPAAAPATQAYSVAYINGDGRLSRGASSERYKKYISDIDPDALGDLWPQLVRYQMRQGDGTWKYGYIAERLAENVDQEPFVVYSEFDGEQVPESIDFIALLIAQNAQLHHAVDLLAQRLDALEARDGR
ncbi:hypothetical protein [Microbacterium sp. NPDC057658]|uniref:hypothetical protein n=1 Tax=unclassified Microbacterium TaxID=2609290 RepID=UPI00366EBDC1